MSEKVNPLVGRAAELNEYATSDLSVEENLAGGASVDDLISAGVLYDDYDPDSRDFTPLRSIEDTEAEAKLLPKKPLISGAEFRERMDYNRRFFKMSVEFRKEANQRRTWT